MSSISKNVDYDIDEFSDHELIEEIYVRGLDTQYRQKEIEELDDKDIISVLEGRGYSITKNHRKIERIFSTFNTMPRKFFIKELKKFFSDELGIYIR